jgi:uncharacterized protein (TIGR00730 family)
LKKKICIFGGSNSGANNTNIQNAKTVGQLIAESNFDIVFGGGEKGIMGAISSSGVRFGARTTGITPEFLLSKDVVNSSIPNIFNSELLVTQTMHERKKMMYEKSEAFIILPGGVGTLDECFEVLTWCQLDLIKNKKVGIINFNGYWSPLILLIKHLINQQFMSPDNLNHFDEIKNKSELKKFLKNI